MLLAQTHVLLDFTFALLLLWWDLKEPPAKYASPPTSFQRSPKCLTRMFAYSDSQKDCGYLCFHPEVSSTNHTASRLLDFWYLIANFFWTPRKILGWSKIVLKNNLLYLCLVFFPDHLHLFSWIAYGQMEANKAFQLLWKSANKGATNRTIC